MSNNNSLFARYPDPKLRKFTSWMSTPHGKQVYGLFCTFARKWRDAGNDRCSAQLIVNRLRWEVGIVGKYNGYRITNDFAPMMARQLALEDTTFAGFFSFHGDGDNHQDAGTSSR